MNPSPLPTVLVLSVSSDIGSYLAGRYLASGHRVIGTYRSTPTVKALSQHPHCRLFSCDIHKPESLARFVDQLKKLKIRWDALISCVGYPLPLGPFFNSDFDQWQESVEVNSIDQLRAVHGLYPLRNAAKKPDIVFFAGGGANNAVVDFSAYTIGKIMLTKMCEFLDAENPDLNIFIVGPGWTRTKIHQMVLSAPQISREKYLETKKRLRSGGTSLEEIFECIQWLRGQGKKITGGRNFSVVYDPWRGIQRNRLVKQLKADPWMYKLRRHNNDFLQKRSSRQETQP